MGQTSNQTLLGKKIVTQDGREIGHVDAVFVDTDDWRVDQLAVKLRKDVLEELSLRRPLIGTQVVRIPTDQIAGASDTVVLRPEAADLSFIGGSSEDANETSDEDDTASAAHE